MTHSELDSPEIYERLDPEAISGRIAGLPEQIEEAWAAGSALKLPPDYTAAERIVVLGMGGSAIGGSLLQALALELRAERPVLVARGYTAPRFADGNAVVFGCSASGNTEETVSAFAQAADAGAKSVAITTGGKLLAMARERGLPALTFAWDGEPRSALGWGFATLAAICGGAGLLPDVGRELPAALEHMRALGRAIGREAPEASNPAKQLARRLAGRLPVFVGAEFMTPVAYRWRTQVNENGKSWAIAEELPEMNHNGPVGYGLPAAAVPLLHIVLLRHESMHPRIRLRVDATLEQMDAAGLTAEVLDVPGGHVLAQMLWAVHFGDWVSYYLGLLNGARPSPVVALDWLKAQMAAQA